MTNKDKKKICYLIFAVGKANGGHYRSLRMIAETLSMDFEIIVINIGYTYSPIIKNSKLENYFVYFNGLTFLSTIREIAVIIETQNIDYIHSFDYLSFFIARIISCIYRIPCLLTKCGGPSPTGYYPYAKYLTVFSTEDYRYFNKSERYKDSIIQLIPNRVADFVCDKNKIRKLMDLYNLRGKVIFLRICRISQFYKESIEQSINLIRYLSTFRLDIVLLIIGNIQEKNIFNELYHATQEDDNIHFVTDVEFYADAKEIIEVANFVIGTGRGFMEACCKARAMLAPGKNHKYPILITDENFKDAFDKNFSERVLFKEEHIFDNLNKIKRLLDSEEELEKISIKSLDWYEKYFSIENVQSKYNEIYNLTYYYNDKYFDWILHWLYIVRRNVGNWLRSIVFS